MKKGQLVKATDFVKKKRKFIVTFMVIVCVGMVGVSGYAVYNDDRMVAPVDVPQSIKDFIAQYFSGRQITGAMIDFLDYDVWLDDNTHIEFGWNRKWDKVESFNSEIRSDLIPATIMKYMEQNHQEAIINKISKEYFGYRIGVLGADHEYRFNKAGQYIGWDD